MFDYLKKTVIIIIVIIIIIIIIIIMFPTSVNTAFFFVLVPVSYRDSQRNLQVQSMLHDEFS